MKSMHIRFSSPLEGRIVGEEVFDGTPYQNEGMIIGAHTMARLYENNPRLSAFLQQEEEDLTQYVPEELQKFILKITVGDYGVLNSKLCLIHHVWLSTEVDDVAPEQMMDEIEEYILGQLSDGWGEGVEQCEWMSETVQWSQPYYDEDCLGFENEECFGEVSYFVEPWKPGLELEEIDREEEDLEVEFQEVARYDRTKFEGFVRTIYLVTSSTQRNYLCLGVDTKEVEKLSMWHNLIEKPAIIALDKDVESGVTHVCSKFIATEIQTPVGVKYRLFQNGEETILTDLNYVIATMLTT